MSEITGQKVIIDFVDSPRQVHHVPADPNAVRGIEGFLQLNVNDEQTLLFPIHTIKSVKILAETEPDE